MVMKKFIRTEQLIGKEALKRLAGRGLPFSGWALSVHTLWKLARSGVGYLRLVDFDVIKPSNFNRQLYALDSNLGLSKTEVAERRVRDINSGCVVDARNLFLIDRQRTNFWTGRLMLLLTPLTA